MWVVIASVGVVALAGLTLRTDGRRAAAQRERQVARQLEFERRSEQRKRDQTLAEQAERRGAATASGTPPIEDALHAR